MEAIIDPVPEGHKKANLLRVLAQTGKGGK